MGQNLEEGRRKLTGPVEPPKPVKSTSKKSDPIRFRRHLFTRMRSVGVQRATVELNYMSPVQRLVRGGEWDLTTFPVAHFAAVESTSFQVHIHIPFLDRATFDDFDEADGIDQNCAITVPADGSLALRGRLIVEFQDAAMDEEPGLQRTQVIVGYGGEGVVAAINRPIVWHTHSQHRVDPTLDGSGLLQIADHDGMVSNEGTAYGQRRGAVDTVTRPGGRAQPA